MPEQRRAAFKRKEAYSEEAHRNQPVRPSRTVHMPKSNRQARGPSRRPYHPPKSPTKMHFRWGPQNEENKKIVREQRAKENADRRRLRIRAGRSHVAQQMAGILGSLTVPQLRVMAREAGIKGARSMRREQLVNTLMENPRA